MQILGLNPGMESIFGGAPKLALANLSENHQWGFPASKAFVVVTTFNVHTSVGCMLWDIPMNAYFPSTGSTSKIQPIEIRTTEIVLGNWIDSPSTPDPSYGIRLDSYGLYSILLFG